MHPIYHEKHSVLESLPDLISQNQPKDPLGAWYYQLLVKHGIAMPLQWQIVYCRGMKNWPMLAADSVWTLEVIYKNRRNPGDRKTFQVRFVRENEGRIC